MENSIVIFRRTFGTIKDVSPSVKSSLYDEEPPTNASVGPPAFEGRLDEQQ